VRELYPLCLDIADMPQAWPVVPRYEHHGIRRKVHGRYLIAASIRSPYCRAGATFPDQKESQNFYCQRVRFLLAPLSGSDSFPP
jgi:hypothetical protein